MCLLLAVNNVVSFAWNDLQPVVQVYRESNSFCLHTFDLKLEGRQLNSPCIKSTHEVELNSEICALI